MKVELSEITFDPSVIRSRGDRSLEPLWQTLLSITVSWERKEADPVSLELNRGQVLSLPLCLSLSSLSPSLFLSLNRSTDHSFINHGGMK